MKVLLLVIIVLISILAVYVFLPPVPLLILYGFIAAVPLLLIFLKKNPIAGLMLLFLTTVFQSGIPYIAVPLLPDIGLSRFLWVSLFSILFFEMAMKERSIVPISKIEIGMVLLISYILGSLIIGSLFTKRKYGLNFELLMGTHLIPFSIFIFSKNIFDDEKKIRKIITFFSILGLYLGITAICENFKFLNFLVFPRYIIKYSSERQTGYAVGPFNSTALMGGALMLSFFVMIYLYMKTQNKSWRIINFVSVMVMPFAILFAYNRASWAGFILAFLVVSVFSPKIRKFFIASMAAIIIVVTLAVIVKVGLIDTEKITRRMEQKNSIYDRQHYIEAGWMMFLEKPLLGFGYDTYRDYNAKYMENISGVPYQKWAEGTQSHDIFFVTLAELGIVGLGLTIFVIYHFFKTGMALYMHLPSEGFPGKELPIVFIGMLVAFLVHAQFTGIRNSGFHLSLVFLMAGIIDGLYQKEISQERYLLSRGRQT